MCGGEVGEVGVDYYLMGGVFVVVGWFWLLWWVEVILVVGMVVGWKVGYFCYCRDLIFVIGIW